MPFYIVQAPANQLRFEARRSLTGQWGIAWFIGFMYSILLNLPVELFALIINPSGTNAFTDLYKELMSNPTAPINMDRMMDAYQTLGVQTTPSVIYALLVSGAITIGLVTFALNVIRGFRADQHMIFSGFERFGKAFVTYLLISIFTALWSCLCIVPGIIAAFRYSQAFYYLADNPELSPLEAINLSKQAMKGNKMKLFCLYLSFIGWMILAYVPAYALSSILTYTGAPAFINIITTIISAAAFGLVYSYREVAIANFYLIINGLKPGMIPTGPYANRVNQQQ